MVSVPSFDGQSCAHQVMRATRTFLTCQHVTVDVGDNGVGVRNIVLNLRDDPVRVYNTLMNVGNDGVGVRDVVMDVGNDCMSVCDTTVDVGNGGLGVRNIMANVRNDYKCVDRKFGLEASRQ